MRWSRRKREIEQAAARLEEATKKVADVRARELRLLAEIEIYGPLMKRQKR